MNRYSIWQDFGLRSNPYDNQKLPGDEEGNLLLVGREEEIEALQYAIGSGGAHPTVEGPVGAGKSSLVNVVGYRMRESCLAERDGVLYLPASSSFEMEENLDDFERKVFRVIAETLIDNVGAFGEADLDMPEVGGIDEWLHSPAYQNRSTDVSAGGFGFGRGKGSQANDGGGFEKDGLTSVVRSELARCLPEGTGGIICVLDNLELLETAERARATLEALRDRVFNVPQLRWVLCGSRGVISNSMSDRLGGYFARPLELGQLPPPVALAVVDARFKHFGHEATPPVTATGFQFLYGALHQDLRQALATADQFSHFFHGEVIRPGRDMPEEEERVYMLRGWLRERALARFEAAGGLGDEDWGLLKRLADEGGRVAASAHGSVGLPDQEAFTRIADGLCYSQLLVEEYDPKDEERKVYALATDAWLLIEYWRDLDVPGASR